MLIVFLLFLMIFNSPFLNGWILNYHYCSYWFQISKDFSVFLSFSHELHYVNLVVFTMFSLSPFSVYCLEIIIQEEWCRILKYNCCFRSIDLLSAIYHNLNGFVNKSYFIFFLLICSWGFLVFFFVGRHWLLMCGLM